MQTREFTRALTNNIKRTFTYSYAKNTGNEVDAGQYDPIRFFVQKANKDPFKAFMTLERYGYKRAKKEIDRYGFEYTPQQERSAKLLFEVTELMNTLKRDFVPKVYFQDIPDLTDTEVADLGGVLTTWKTLDMHNRLNRLSVNKETDNLVYENLLSDSVLSQRDQMAAIKNCLTYHVSCLIGGAGTGKSYVTARIIEQLKANDKEVVILAPTHKAKESLQTKLTDGTVVRTIHSFIHGYDKSGDVIIVDEAGMLSTPLCQSLLRSYKNQQLIFVGDKNQLAPIEYGRPFEKIQKRFHTYELTKNRRSESPDIVTLGKEIIGEPTNHNMAFPNIIRVATEQEAFEQGAEVVLTFRNDDVNRVNEMKRVKNGQLAISNKFSVGDTVIAKTNQKQYFNGQIFEVVAYDRLEDKQGRTVKLNNYRDLEYNFDLAYGLTIHKSQGSEWGVVAYKPSELDTRRLAYVAVTRAKQKLIIIGGLQSQYQPEEEWLQLN